jgi:transmembrane sensor
MDRIELKRLAKKYLNGTATLLEREQLNQWYEAIHNAEQTEIINTETEQTEAEVKQQIFDKIRERIILEKLDEEKIKGHSGFVKKMAFRIASAAAVIFIIGGFLWYLTRRQTENIAGNNVLTVTAKKVIKITLADGSDVWLSAHTVFKYPRSFTGKVREVELIDGRAFFDVVHKAGHPFFVKTKTLNITVLGTSFDVRTYQKEGTTKVSVISGKVGVTVPGQPETAAVMLLPKQQVVLSKATSQLTKAPANEMVVNLWCKNPLVFDQENLDSVFKAIEKQYNTHIEVADKKLLNERISITLGNQRLDTIMEILSFTKHFKYQIANDSTVVIK